MSTQGGLRGRTREIVSIDQLLDSSDVRLLTLTGLPGVGKTRLAKWFTQPSGTSPLRPTVWVDAIDLADSELLPSMISNAAGLERQSGIPIESVAAALDSTPRLLVIDHVDEGPRIDQHIADILENSVTTKVLLAARAPLRIPGEHVVRVDPFTSDQAVALENDPAVQVFTDIARSSGGRLSDDAETLRAISSICDRLGGLPGAIELAASRTPTLSPATILHLLDGASSKHTLARAETGRRDIFGAIEWSESLLTSNQQALLRDFTVFESPVPIEAIEAVTGRRGLVDDLSNLVDTHLVDAQHDHATTTFSLPMLVSEHATQHLSMSNPQRQRELSVTHSKWALSVAEPSSRRSTTEYGSVDARVRLGEVELAAALSRAMADDATTDAAVLAIALAPIWFNRGARTFECEYLEQVAAAMSTTTTEPGLEALVRGWSLLLHSERAMTLDDNIKSVHELEQIVSLARRAERGTLLRVLALGVRTARAHDQRAEMVALCSEGLEISQQIEDKRSIAAFQIWGAMLDHQGGRVDEATERGLQALDLARHIDDVALIIAAGGFLKTLPPGSLSAVSRPLPSARELADAARDLDDKRMMSWLLPTASFEALQSGDLETSASLAIESIEAGRQAGLWMWCVAPMLNLLWIATADESYAEAAYLHGIVSTRSETTASSLPPGLVRKYEATVNNLRNTMDSKAFDSAASKGALLSFHDATSEAIAYGRTIVDRTVSDGQSPLTERELEVVEQLVRGDTNKDIARTLDISPKTVMHHTSSIYRKLNVRGRAETVAWALSSI